MFWHGYTQVFTRFVCATDAGNRRLYRVKKIDLAIAPCNHSSTANGAPEHFQFLFSLSIYFRNYRDIYVRFFFLLASCCRNTFSCIRLGVSKIVENTVKNYVHMSKICFSRNYFFKTVNTTTQIHQMILTLETI